MKRTKKIPIQRGDYARVKMDSGKPGPTLYYVRDVTPGGLRCTISEVRPDGGWYAGQDWLVSLLIREDRPPVSRQAVCPACGKSTRINPGATVNCGDCLMERCEVVRLKETGL